jgi:DNA-binding transcriptional MerR regulator
MTKSEKAFRTISEVSKELDVPAHVLRFWETKFPQVKPMKRGGGRRYYRPEDISLLRGVREMLHIDGFSIKGVQKALKEQGVRAISDRSEGVPVATSIVQQDVPVDAVAAATARADGALPMSAAERKALRKALEALVTLRENLIENGRAAA